MATREDLIKGIDAAWQPLRTAIEGLDEADFEQPTVAGWTAKEMLAHIAFWDEAIEPVLGWVLEGENPPTSNFGSGYVPGDEDWPHPDVHNAREAEWARSRTVADVLARLDEAHRSAVEAVRNLPDDRLAQDKYVDYIRSCPAHYIEHVAELHPPAGV